MAQMKKQNKTPEKELNKMEINNLSDTKFKPPVMMLKELSEDLNVIKKIQSETKDTLIEIKNDFKGNNSRVGKPRIKSMIWNIRNHKQPVRRTRKKNPQK